MVSPALCEVKCVDAWVKLVITLQTLDLWTDVESEFIFLGPSNGGFFDGGWIRTSKFVFRHFVI